jgi:putative ABC transport system permease protein
MSVIKRGFLYITRKRSRSVLLLVIMFVAAVLAMLGLAVKQSADRETDNLRKSLASSFVLNLDEAKNTALWNQYGGSLPYDKRPVVSAALISRILKMDHITGYYTDEQEMSTWVDLQLRPGSSADTLRRYQKNPALFAMYPVDLNQLNAWGHVATYCGCSDSGLHEFFRNGAFTLREGRHIRADDVHKAVISTDLARRNGLSVGDTITIEDKVFLYTPGGTDYDTIAGEPIKLELVGLFDVNFSQEPSIQTDTNGETYVYTGEMEFAENMIFTDLPTLKQEIRYARAYLGRAVTPAYEEYEKSVEYAVFFVDGPENLEAAVAEVSAVKEIDWNYFYVKPDDSTYKTNARPLKQLAAVSSVLIAIAVVGSVSLLGLTLNMWTKSRKREMAILMSLGVAKRELVLQQLLESLTVAIAALLLAAVVSGALAGPVGNLANRLASNRGTGSAYTVRETSYEVIAIDKVSSDPVNLTYGLSAQNVLIAAAAVLGSTALSVGLTARNITKMKPKAALRAI